VPVDLLTSAHVVEGADTAEAAFTDGTTGRKSGLPVAQVMPQSPAAQSGLHVGDIVVSVAGEPIGSTTALQRTMVEDPIGRRLEITVWRNGALVDVIAVPAS
jgi:Trypsin-like serine proteases, typically periplasmic, contain C-terminal PDZ domain